MKKLLLLATGLLLFGCETQKTETENTEISETTTTETNADESVEIGAGAEISPQLEGIEDTASRLEVEPLSNTKEANGQK